MTNQADDMIGERFGSGTDAADEREHLARARRDPALELCALDADSDLVDVSAAERGRVRALVGRDVVRITVYARAAGVVVPVARYVVSAAMLEPSWWRPAPARRTLARQLDNGRVLRLSLGPVPDGVEYDDGVVRDALAVDVSLSPTLGERVRAHASAIRRPRVRVAVRATVGLIVVIVASVAIRLFLGGPHLSPSRPSGNQSAATNTRPRPVGNANASDVTNIAPELAPPGPRATVAPEPELAEARIPGLTTRQTADVRTARDTGSLVVPDVSALATRTAATLAPEAGTLPEQQYPVARVVRDAEFAFSWSAVEKASAYVVSVYDLSRPDVAYDSSPELATTSWINGRPLERGRTYKWSVEAVLADGDRVFAPAWAHVRVLSHSADAELAAAERRHPDDRVLLGILYARVGLVAEARKHFTAAIDAGAERELAIRLRDELDRITSAARDERRPPEEETP